MKLNTEEKIYHGNLAKGCDFCVEGRKSVLFVTGKCHYQCFYCPISDDKRNTDIFKINELVVAKPDSVQGAEMVVDEIVKCQSTGVGITGGDPLAELDRTCRYIKLLKKTFGEDFHIHLYTSLPYVNKKTLSLLQEAGLDELRLHIDTACKDSWKTVLLAMDWKRDLGVEVPVIPGEERAMKELLDFCKQSGIVKFVNLNELEYSDISENVLTEKGFFVKNELSYGIKESETLAKRLVEYGARIDLPVHYCSCSFKDRVQLGNRLLLRAQNIALPFDIVDEEGMITRGVITPKHDACVKLCDVAKDLQEQFDIPQQYMLVEEKRILIASWIVQEIWSKFDNKESFEALIVTHYPTADEFVVEKTLL